MAAGGGADLPVKPGKRTELAGGVQYFWSAGKFGLRNLKEE